MMNLSGTQPINSYRPTEGTMTTESLTFRHITWIGDDAMVDITRTTNTDGTISVAASARRCDDDNTGDIFIPWGGGETTYAQTFPAGTFDGLSLDEVIGEAVAITG